MPLAQRCTPDMARQLGAERLGRLDARSDIVYAVDAGLRLAYANPAWFDNWPSPAFHSRWGLGADISCAWPALLKGPMELLFRDLAAGQADGSAPLRLDYACPTETLERRFTLWAHPLPEGVLVVNALVSARAVAPPAPPLLADYLADDGLLHQCLNCRRTLAPATQRWDWVPEWVRDLPEGCTSDLCPRCEGGYLRRLHGLGARVA